MSLPDSIGALWTHLESTVGDALESLGLDRAVNLAPPPDPEMGDLGFPCFQYAKVLRRAPAQIAGEIAAAIAPDTVLAEVGTAGPYVNLRIRADALAGVLLGQVCETGDRWAADCPAGS